MSDDRQLKCLQPAIKEKFPVVFHRKWSISKFCRRECSLVLYAKNRGQAILSSIFNWASDLLVSLGKSKRPSISSLINWGWSLRLTHWGGLWVGKHHWKFETQLTITYYCLSVLPKKAAAHDKDSWLIMLPASLLVKRDPRINIWKRVLLSLLGTLTFSWFLLFLPAPASGLIIRTRRAAEGWETGRLTSKNPLPRIKTLFRGAPPGYADNASIAKPTPGIPGCQWQTTS